MDEEFEFRIVGKPKESFCPSNLTPERPIFLISNQLMELDGIKGPPHSINEARNIVLDSFRNILSFISLGYPSLTDLCFLKIESLLEDLI